MFISSGFSALTTMIIRPIAMGVTRNTKFDALSLSNGALVGMVAISASVDNIENWAAVLIGTISAFAYLISLLTLNFYRIDDPLETISVHLAGGAWGLFAAGFFDKTSGSLFYGALNQGAFMGYQLVGILVIFLFTSVIMLPAFLILRKLHVLRAEKAVEEIGFDVAHIYPGVSREFLDAVNEKIETREEQEKKLHQFDHIEHFSH
jgi:Amt family ammonium transporter